MAALTDVVNATFDTAAAAVPAAVGGPLTRVTDLSADPVISPNSQLKVECTSAAGVTVYISYDELVDTNVRDKLVMEAHGQTGQMKRIFDFIAALDVLNDDGFDPFAATPDDLMGVLRLFQTNIVPILNSHPIEVWHEVPANAALAAAFTEDFSDPINTVTNTTEKEAVAAWAWFWGDGTISWDWEPAPHTYGSSGTYTTTLVCIGKNGISTATGAGNVVA